MKSEFEQMGGTYSVVGDYLIPDLIISEQESLYFGKYGGLRKTYLKNHKPGIYNSLLLSGRLNEHLHEIDVQAKEQVEFIMKQLMISEEVTEKLKAVDQMKWVGAVNSIKARAEEIVFSEIIYS